MKTSSGIIAYSVKDGKLLFLAGHPGGCRNDYWTMFKGECADGEELAETAVREFCEETGIELGGEAITDIVYLGCVKQSNHKRVHAFALEVDYDGIDLSACHSNKADNCDWDEIDRYAWFDYDGIVSRTHRTHKIFYDKISNNYNQWKR